MIICNGQASVRASICCVRILQRPWSSCTKSLVLACGCRLLLLALDSVSRKADDVLVSYDIKNSRCEDTHVQVLQCVHTHYICLLLLLARNMLRTYTYMHCVTHIHVCIMYMYHTRIYVYVYESPLRSRRPRGPRPGPHAFRAVRTWRHCTLAGAGERGTERVHQRPQPLGRSSGREERLTSALERDVLRQRTATGIAQACHGS